jgi:hypothetical protein
MGERFYTGTEDCEWLRTTALHGYDVPKFRSFTLEGQEDCPLVIRLWEQAQPTLSDGAIAFYELVTKPHSNLAEYRRR